MIAKTLAAMKRVLLSDAGKATEWSGSFEGRNYDFAFKRRGKQIWELTVNGRVTRIVRSRCRLRSVAGFDEPFLLDGREARLAFSGGVPFVLVDGVCLQGNGE